MIYHTKALFSICNTHVDEGPNLVGPYDETSTKNGFVGNIKAGAKGYCFPLSAVCMSSYLQTRNQSWALITKRQFSKILNKAGL